MAFLHKDKRGFFYLCESRRKGARVARVKLAYLGRMEIPVYGPQFRYTLQREIGKVKRGKVKRGKVKQGNVKPTLGLAYRYCHTIADVILDPERKLSARVELKTGSRAKRLKNDAAIIARAARVLKIIRQALYRKTRHGKAGEK